MITTVTMNPAIDKTISIETLVAGGLNRVKTSQTSAGGKGINVAKALTVLGSNTLALGVVAGTAGKWIEAYLDSNSIKHDLIEVKGETRTNLKIFDEKLQQVTEVNEPGVTIPSELVEQVILKVTGCAACSDFVVLSGSVPQGCPSNIYAQIIKAVAQVAPQAKVALDADGDLFRAALPTGPAIIKPNLHELEQYLGRSLVNDEEVTAAGRKLMEQGVSVVLISMGAEGSIMITDSEAYKALPLSVEVKSTVSAGDSMLAGLLHALSQGLAPDECLRLASACGTAAVMTAGTEMFELEQVLKLRELVVVKEL